MFSIDPSTRTWIAQTLAGYICLLLWLGSVIAPPVIVLGAAQPLVFALAVGALGLQAAQSYVAVGRASAAKKP